ncbi:MAG TPA: helix-turn-helix transcriptional regulator [Chitinophagaceae bacterium]|nr:helix-turn-helix transcriptional regulator [Chitinophagaceae bacterium]
MVVFNLSHDNYQTLLQNLARQLKVKPQDNSITIPPEIGEGIIKVIVLPNGLQTLMVKINFFQDVFIKSGNTNKGAYVLNFDELEVAHGKSADAEKDLNSFVRLTGSSFKHLEVVKKNSVVQYVKILFSKEWLSNYIGLREKLSQFEKYIPVKSDAAEKEKLNEEYRRIIKELWLINDNDPLQNISNNNRILLLIEQFFTKMHAEMINPKGKYRLTADDIVKLKKIESILNSPGRSPLNVAELAKKATMTKLKFSHAFRQVYGTGVYNYYQNQRMQKAHELLSTGNFSVKEVSEKLGYTNLSNFVLAFTKQFNTSPKSLLE